MKHESGPGLDSLARSRSFSGGPGGGAPPAGGLGAWPPKDSWNELLVHAFHEHSSPGECNLRGNDVDGLAATLGAELDRARREGEQGVVTATADVHAGVEVGAALADQDLAG